MTTPAAGDVDNNYDNDDEHAIAHECATYEDIHYSRALCVLKAKSERKYCARTCQSRKRADERADANALFIRAFF